MSKIGYKQTIEHKNKLQKFLTPFRFKRGSEGYWKGKKRPPFSESWKRKIGEAAKIRRYPNRKGHPHSEETKKKLSEFAKKIGRKPTIIKSGEEHYRWKGGITPMNQMIRKSEEYKLWRKSVFERDNYICIWCGKNGGVEADHIKPFSLFPELRFAIDNGRTLCKECHRKTDTYGWILYHA